MSSNPKQDLLTAGIYAVTAIIGIVIFTYPILLTAFFPEGLGGQQFQADTAPLITFLLLIICLSVLFLEIQGQAVSAKVIASLGVLVAATAALRFLEIAIPGPGGFSPMFVPIILAGYVFGARFGFLLGTMAMLVSALITGGIGPWLPYQMFAAGWIGLTSGWLPHFQDERMNLVMLTIFGAAWGLIYGLLLNLYFWPFLAGPGGLQSGSETAVGSLISQFFVFYITTSLVWDFARALGNGLLLAFLAIPTIRVLTRFRDKYRFEVKSA